MASNSATLATPADRQTIRASERLVVALDFDEASLAEQLVATLGDAVSCYKVGYHLQLVSGYDKLVDRLIDSGKRVLLDTKVCDIKDTVRAAVNGALKRNASFLTIHGNGDVTDSALQAAVEARGDAKLELLLVTVLTHMDDLDLHAIHRTSVMDEALRRAERAIKFNLNGVICSGHEAEEIRRRAGTPQFTIATPGIRPVGSPREDQKRVMTPADAVSRGADYLIVGRPIIRSADPRQAVADIVSEMQGAFDRR